ncbi:MULTISPECIES: peptidylprolyl isomerase [Marinimicrobium]|jgi:peptidyl-prolyl cis-trans isomerase SurA|uniref:Chaperone SurA n=1 Tax=Marinimicrobium koreense TaxID=306545 RepID=A0A3N1P163_9GAMM|nr:MULTISPECIES: peptidylprolyl isomerase [Marinimicrobium]ROQ20997.1 periplasmic chaperone for outer membrane proteins SurA [Marinimicrobium koreense]
MQANRITQRLIPAVLALLLASPLALAETEMLDRVVAIVGEDVVLESELEERLASIKARIQQSDSNQNLPPDSVLRDQILDQLILERLQMEMGRRFGIEVSDQQLDQTIARIMQTNNLTEAQLRADLESQGQTLEGFRDQIRREMWVNQIQQAVVNSRIDVNQQDIESFLASTDGKFATSPNYRLGHILLSVPSSASDEEASEVQEEAERIRQELVDGADFEQMAITHSNDANALQGGEIGWRKLEQLPELFADVVAGLEEGDVSEPVRSGAGFHILKVHETRSNTGNSMVEQTKARHILIKTSEIVDDAAAEQKLTELRERVLNGESFADLAREHSEDIGSMLQGGDLGWTMPGQMVPAFDQTMNETDVGEVSEPFKSQFGWHILTVEDRREQDMSEQMIRNQAANMLRERRFDEELQTWLAEIREEIYVEEKL